jgi:hypothetical protein
MQLAGFGRAGSELSPFLRYFSLSLSLRPCYNSIEIIPAAAPIPAKKSKASIF